MAQRGRKTIVQRIALDGGKEIEAEFKALGAAGERAFAQLRDAALKSQNLSPLANAVTRLKAQFTSLGESASNVGSSFSRLGPSIGATIKGMIALEAASLAAKLSLAAVIKSSADAADELGKNAQAAGLTIEQYQALEYAAGQSGVSAEQFAKGMVRINEAISDAAKKSQGALEDLADNGIRAVQSFDQLGGNNVKVVKLGTAMDETRKKARELGQSFVNAFEVSGVTLRVAGEKVKGLEGPLGALQRLNINPVDGLGKARPALQVIEDFADALSELPDGVEKSGLAIDFFGAKLGGKFIPLLNGGREGLRELVDEFYKMQTGFNKTQFKAGEKLNDTFSKLGTTIGGVRNQIGALFFEDATTIGEGLIGVVERNRTSLIEFARQIRAAVLPYFRAVRNFLAGGDEEGRDTRAGSLENKLASARDSLVAFGQAALRVGVFFKGVFDSILAGADRVANVINDLFGTRLTGGELLIGAVVVKLLGGFKLLGTAIQFTIGLLEGLGLKGTAAVAGLGLLLVANIAKWDDIKKAATDTGEAIKKALSGDFSGAFDELKKTSASTWALIATDAVVAILGIARAVGAVTLLAGGGPIGWLILGGLSIAAAVALFWDPIKKGFLAALKTGGELWETFKSDARNAVEEIVSGFTSGFKKITDKIDGFLAKIREAVDAVRNFFGVGAPPTPDNQINNGVGQENIFGGAGNDTFGTSPDFTQTTASARAAFDEVYQIASEAIGRIQADAYTLGQSIRDFIVGGFDAVGSAAATATSSVQSAAASMVQALESVIRAAQEAAQAASSAAGGSSLGFASGGPVRGPGTGTSDSIPAWLSNGEFVVRAAAVKKYGLGLLQAINGMSADRFRLGIPAFATGGLVAPVAVPSIGGGPSSVLNLTIGNETFAGLTAPADVADRLARYAAKRVASSAGRRPSWVGA